MFNDSSESVCNIHPGFKRGGRFTCCGREGFSGCTETKHETVNWPDEKAKLYFFPKIVDNPGLKFVNKGKEDKEEKITSGHQICKAGLFKEVIPYESAQTKHELLKMKREKELQEPKLCLNWCCGVTFKDTEEENLPKSCVHHPGKFDHGSTGMKMDNYISEIGLDPKERKSVLWEPHWTCCRKKWEAKGCKFSRHRGILLEQAEEHNPRPYNWPDVRAKLYFGKTVSEKWKKNLEKYTYPDFKVKAIVEKNKDKSLTTICDELRLYLLVINDKPDYHLKFMDIVNHKNSVNFFQDAKGNLSVERFVKWWFADYSEIMAELAPKKKEEK